MEVADFLLGGFLGSLLTTFISYSLSMYFQKYLIEYRRKIKAIRKLKLNQEYSFSILYQLVIDCIKYNPDCLINPKKLYKDLHLLKPGKQTNGGITQKDIKKVLVNVVLNMEKLKEERDNGKY